MSEISLNVGYRNIFKKITCPKSNTINQLIGLAFEKFNINKSTNIGELRYNGKNLDNSLPLRLTNLTNNSKIELTVKTVPKEHFVNIKLLANLPSNEVKTFVLKINSSLLLREMLEEFEKTNQINLINHEGYSMQLQVINSRVEETEFNSLRLNSITGLGVSNVVIRLGYLALNKDSRVKEQQNIIKTQLQQQKIRNQMKREQEEKNRKLQKLVEPADIPTKKTTSNASDTQESNESNAQESDETIIKQTASPTPAIGAVESDMEVDQLHQEDSVSYTAPKPSESPKLFMPSKTPNKIYENPEDDYDMTLSQAQTYQQLIRNSAKPLKKATTQASTPSQYFIRVKFPDQTILQLDFENAKETKLGTLFKKIDELILPDFVNSYSLKLSYPPFKTIEMSFAANNTLMVDHPYFKAERIVLIWEPQTASKGPYVNTYNIRDIKQAADLPELVIENNRASFASDVPSEQSEHPQSTGHKSPKTAKSGSRAKQFPKWFKLT